MMKQLMIIVALVWAVPALADTFGSGDNQFTIEFVPISGDASSANGTNISTGSPGDHDYKTFTDPGHDYRIAKYQITNAQWASFEAETGLTFTSSYWTGAQIPVNRKNWYAAAQFVNWLNTSNDHQAAYNFNGCGYGGVKYNRFKFGAKEMKDTPISLQPRIALWKQQKAVTPQDQTNVSAQNVFELV